MALCPCHPSNFNMVPCGAKTGEAIKGLGLHWIAMYLRNKLNLSEPQFPLLQMEVVVPLSLGFSLRKMKELV